MKRAKAILLISVLVVAGGAEPEKVKLSPDEKAILDLLNQERKKEKLAELALDPVLCKVARAHCENMARQDAFSHELDGKKVGARVHEAGYDYRAVGENLAKTESDGDGDPPPMPPGDIHKKWMDSKGHRDNILNPKFRDAGLSIVRGKKGAYFYTQVFAVRLK